MSTIFPSALKSPKEPKGKGPSRFGLLSACLGNFFEHYDTALFGFLSVFLAPLIFPEKDPITALILTYAMIPLGMLARPIGSLVFGFIGDSFGRKEALFLSLGGMAVVSGCIALSPTYQQAGVLAPIIFGFGRVAQNFLAAGETMGGAIFLLENSSKNRHDILSSLYNSSTIGGILLASAGVTILSQYNLVEWGWRLLYVLGCVTALFGLMVRKAVPSETWQGSSQRRATHLLTTFWMERKSLCLIAITSGFAYANYSIALILMNGFVPLVTSMTKAEVMGLNTCLLVIDFCALPFFGWISSKTSRESMMLGAALCVVFTAIPLFMLLPQAGFVGILGIRICLVLLGVAFFAPFHAWAISIVVPEHRYVVISLGYALGSQLLGGPTAALSLWAFQKTGMVASVAWYWLFLAVLSCFAVAATMKKKVFLKVSA